MQFLPGSGRIDTAIWMHYMDCNKMAAEEARRQLHKNAASNLEQVLAATPNKKPTDVMYSYGPPHMAEQKQHNQHKHTFSNYVRIRDVVQKTCQRRWTIGKSGERGSGISMLPAQHDDDDDYEIVKIVCEIVAWRESQDRQGMVKIYN